MELSVVTTLYRSEAHLRDFYARVTAAASSVTKDFELILVNDGSPDSSLTVALELHRADPRVRVVDLSRNFGHHRAIMVGLEHSHGDQVFLIDCDLEEDPELLLLFHLELRRSGADVVYGFQESRQSRAIYRWSSAAYYAVFNLLSDIRVPPNLCTVRLMSRRYVRNLLLYREREANIAGLWQLTGFQQIGLPIVKRTRGQSSYTWPRRFQILVNSITSFSGRPLVFVFYLGLTISLAAAAAAFYLVVKRLFFGALLAGWPSLIVSVWLLGGLTLLCVGLLGIYLSKVFLETKQRPTIVREIYEADDRK